MSENAGKKELSEEPGNYPMPAGELSEEPGKPDEEEAILEKWKNIPLADMVTKGYYARVKTVRGTKYMSLRNRVGDKEKSLGVYTQKKWALLMEKFPGLKEGESSSPNPKREKGKGADILDIPIKKGVDIPKKYEPGLKTLAYFKYFKEIGLPVGFSQFVDDVIILHCEKCEGYTWGMVRKYHE